MLLALPEFDCQLMLTLFMYILKDITNCDCGYHHDIGVGCVGIKFKNYMLEC